MKARTVLGAALGTVGGAVVGNHLLKRRAGDLESPLPGIERTYRWRGIESTYTVAGDPNDPDMLLLHGIYAGASSREFAPIMEQLADDYHVYAVDLPGFARSERPPLIYSASLYAEFIRDFAADITDEPIVVASSVTGAFAADAADETDIERLVLICPTEETSDARPWVRTLLRTPIVGTALYNLLASKPSIRYFYDRDGYYDSDRIDADEVQYAWDSAHQPGARYAPLPSPRVPSTPSSTSRRNWPPSRRRPRSSGAAMRNSSRSGRAAICSRGGRPRSSRHRLCDPTATRRTPRHVCRVPERGTPAGRYRRRRVAGRLRRLRSPTSGRSRSPSV